MKKKVSSKTTASGIAGILSALGLALNQYLDGGLQGVDFNILLAVAIPSFGLIFSRDHGVSSKDAGL